MPSCPQCTKPLRDFTRRCPSCQADLDLLVDYVSHLQGGLQRADNLTRAGELGQAIWAYLEVLEVDPDNSDARKQIGQVVTAVRQFDTTIPGRRWANGLPPQLPKTPLAWWHWLIIVGVVMAAFAGGFGFAHIPYEPASNENEPDKLAPAPELKMPPNRMFGKDQLGA
jgi:hypothetical protein